MKIRAKLAFGNFVPGDEVEVPDGCIFDTTYFERADEAPPVEDTPDPKGGDK